MKQFIRLTTSPLFRIASLVAALTVIVELFWLGAQPIAVNLIAPPWDKVAHVATYFTISLLLWFAAGLYRQFSIVAIVILVACADEFRQGSLPGRHTDWQDLLANVAALIIFWFIATAYSKFVSAMTTAPSSAQSD